jgi:hypothetical protein
VADRRDWGTGPGAGTHECQVARSYTASRGSDLRRCPVITPPTYKPGSVGRRCAGVRMVIPLRAWSPTPSSSLPAASWSRWTASRCLFGLAPAGVCRATPVTRCAVSSYLTFSALPDPTGEPAGHRRCVFCGTFRRAARAARPGVTWQLIHGARTFLEGNRAVRLEPTRDHPVGDVS